MVARNLGENSHYNLCSRLFRLTIGDKAGRRDGILVLDFWQRPTDEVVVDSAPGGYQRTQVVFSVGVVSCEFSPVTFFVSKKTARHIMPARVRTANQPESCKTTAISLEPHAEVIVVYCEEQTNSIVASDRGKEHHT